MTRFRAAVLQSIGSPPSILDLVGRELDRGQVLVQMVMAGICGSQLSEIAGFKGNEKFLPHLMGHEGFGRVVEVGSDVNSVSPGDFVVLHWRASQNGIAAVPAKYDSTDGMAVGSGAIATLSERVVVSENRVTAVPEDTNPELATLLGCALSTATAALLGEAGLKPGERVLVVGLGGIGLSTLAASLLVHNVLVAGFDRDRQKGEIGQRIRDFSLIDEGVDSLGNLIIPSEFRGGFDVVIDSVGESALFGKFAKLLAPGSRYILIGQGNPESHIDLGPRGDWLKDDSVTFVISQGGGFRPERQLLDFISRYNQIDLDTSALITHKLELERIGEVFSLLEEGTAGIGRAVVKF